VFIGSCDLRRPANAPLEDAIGQAGDVVHGVEDDVVGPIPLADIVPGHSCVRNEAVVRIDDHHHVLRRVAALEVGVVHGDYVSRGGLAFALLGDAFVDEGGHAGVVLGTAEGTERQLVKRRHGRERTARHSSSPVVRTRADRPRVQCVRPVSDRRRAAATKRRTGHSAPFHPVVIGMTSCHTAIVAKAISVRLDDDAERALRMLEATGISRSEAIRSSLLASAERMRARHELAAEVAALEADEADRAEMLAVASLMESMRAAG